ncbi:hypothetical protein OEA41_002659 [Lepraria neglecta]|uniref:Uncharacterized protein n=1 Tax=Lepraria neglecta TaxID=209136 RepID=A0AAE0DKV1_9LECA|nr:hypothetical protein OEA41_002659 [Lepraria neglecta]
MPGYDVLSDRASEPQMAPNSWEESRHMYQTEGHPLQIHHSVPRRTRGNHRLPLAPTNEEHEPFGQPHYSNIQPGGDFYQGQGADWPLTSSDDAEALSSTGVMPNLSAQDSVSQHPWSVSYEACASVPYQSERMSIPLSQPQGYMSPFLEEGQGERASNSLSYRSGWRAQDLSQNHDHSCRQRSTYRSAQDQDYPQSRMNRSAQQGRYDTLRGNDHRTQGNRDHSFDLSRGGINATNLAASGLFSSYTQHNRHVNRPTGLAVQRSQSSVGLDLAAQSNIPKSQGRQEHLQSDSGPIAPAITISSAETYPEVPNSRRFESESSRIRDSPSNSQDKVRREHGTKDKANEGKLRVPRSEDRRRRDHVPRSRSRVLTDEGREHAKQVRKVGACKDCRGRHIRVCFLSR